MKKQKIQITQQDGTIGIYRNGELESYYHIDDIADRIKDGKMSAVALANMVAEIIHDCLNCKTATATLKDLNDTKSYRGTFFEQIDHLTD